MLNRMGFAGRGAAVALVGVAALVAAGCGGGSGGSGGGAPTSGGAATTKAAGDPGEQLFASVGCASCHTLKAADASGHVGPDLDTLKPSEAAVAKQVTNGGGGMPPFKGQLSSTQIHEVATFVAKVAGR